MTSVEVTELPRDWQSPMHGTGSSIPNTSSPFVSRRRSAAVNVPPPGPPPSLPIPHLPAQHAYETYDFDDMAGYSSRPYDLDSNDSHTSVHPYTRPIASANLAAVAAFSQNRHANYASSASSSVDNLSDSPPRSMLRSGARSPVTNDIVPDRLLLSPPEPRTSEPRPSSRRALTKALELAREAVKLDSTNDDPYGAVLAYGKSVSLLSEVMERVMRGEDSTESHRKKNGRRRSVVAQEEEVRRLKSIHDTYADRMNILSLIYSIPLPTTSPPSTYASSSVSVSTASTTPSSPASTSPTSESSHSSRYTNQYSDGGLNSSEIPRIDLEDNPDDMMAIGTAMFAMDTSMSSGEFSPRTPIAPSVHPYAASSSPSSSTASMNSSSTRIRASTPPRPQIGRPRASSTLPPAAPPPTTLPPPAPAHSTPESQALRPPEMQGRQRGSSFTHKRTGSSSRLTALQEEADSSTADASGLDTTPGKTRALVAQISSNGDSHPLPPLPSPMSSEGQDHGTATQPNSPGVLSQRSRGGSTFSERSEMSTTSQAPLINASPIHGSISQRRNKMPSPSTLNGSTSPDLAMQSSLPAGAMASLGATGRSRALSQPGRRPSLVTANTYPVPMTAAPRKVSVPSKLNPNAPPQITINTGFLSPPLTKVSIPPLVPPPPIPHGNIPVAPMSPLPPNAPQDPLRKPYHMMGLLRQTMTSKTGGYVTRRLHVPQEVWSQGGAKLTNIPEKIRVVEVLCSALEEIQSWSVEYFGAGNVSNGMGMGIGSIGKKEAEAWTSKLEEFSSVCDGVVGNFGKKLGVGEGFVTKKSSGVTSWGGRLTRQFDKLTNGKNLDSPAIYVQGLAKLFSQVQILDEHTKAVCCLPIAPLYASFPLDLRSASEMKLRRASEFFVQVVLTFVIRDMALLLDKYVKKCEKWLAE